MRILIAEDDHTSRLMLQALVKKWGFAVVAVADGEEAWSIMQQPESPRLAVLDWMMPGMDGVEVCRRLRAVDNPEPPYLIMLTARGNKADIVEALKAGADDYVQKPFDPEELRARISVGCRILDLQQRLAELANTDPLTGLYNRRRFFEGTREEIARSRRYQYPLSLLMVDVDHFKVVNDTYGHDAGDILLQHLAALFKNFLREGDMVGRLGGEEFAILLGHTDQDQAESVAERIRQAVETQPVTYQDQQIKITLSIGVSQLSPAEEDPYPVLKRADDMLFLAKGKGRNCVVASLS